MSLKKYSQWNNFNKRDKEHTQGDSIMRNSNNPSSNHSSMGEHNQIRGPTRELQGITGLLDGSLIPTGSNKQHVQRKLSDQAVLLTKSKKGNLLEAVTDLVFSKIFPKPLYSSVSFSFLCSEYLISS